MSVKKNVMKSISIAAITVLSIVASPAFAGGDADAGEALSATCAACHGDKGNSTQPSNPILAGQYESYLKQALMAYKSGERANAIMNGMAAPLSDQDIADLAAYYASQDSALRTVEPK